MWLVIELGGDIIKILCKNSLQVYNKTDEKESF